ncbi:unnamed protein product [Penicillium salamii]|uniref:Uncharacterized protein n=1 Tax=Penicillium salamii TaxID=1612424 RepID=A0A9W4NAP7_9EURO|nr:unnamed protein product [Penicillium salamii]
MESRLDLNQEDILVVAILSDNFCSPWERKGCPRWHRIFILVSWFPTDDSWHNPIPCLQSWGQSELPAAVWFQRPSSP